MSALHLDRAALLKRLKKEQKFKTVKPIVTAPTILEKVFHCSNQERSIHYFSSGRKVDQNIVKELEKQPNAFKLPAVAAVPFNALRRVEREKLKEEEGHLTAFEKPSRRTRELKNLSERLFVPANESAKIKQGNVDVDQEFYNVVRGRPIKEKFSVNTYVNDVRKILYTKLKTGFLHDEVYLIDEQFRNERKRIDELTQLYKDYYVSFKEFEAQDHEQWLTIRRQADEMASDTNNMRVELKQLMKELSNIRCSLYVLEESWRNCKLCQIFLFQISPLSWQTEHPLRNREDEEVGSINDLFDRYKLDTEGSVQSLNSLIDIFQEDIAASEGPPQLYFTEPWQVRLVFREMELQHLSSLLIIESIRKPKDIMMQGLQTVKQYYDDEINSIKEQLAVVEELIKSEEERSKTLEEMAKLLTNDLKALVSSDEVLLTHVFVEHAYEECVASGDTDMTTLETMQALKLLHEDLMMKLDSLPVEIVKEAEALVQCKNALALEKAHHARRQVAILDNLTKSMRRALDRPFIRKGRPLMWRSKPPSPCHKPHEREVAYSQREIEFLTFFTDFCRFDDAEQVKLFFPLGTN